MRGPWMCAVIAAVAGLSGCSVRQMGISRMADALTETASAYGRDGDPEFVRLAAPATLKMVEMMLDQQPRHPGLLLTACSGFTQYAFAFLHVEAEIVRPRDAAAARELRARGLRMYERARGYCLRALDLQHSGFSAEVARDDRRALARTSVRDVPALFWLGASWGGSVALAENPLLRLPDLARVKAIMRHALTLDEDWDQGVIHEAMIALEGLPALVGGSPARARQHFARAVQLSGGSSAIAYVTLASSVAVPAGDRKEFDLLIDQALGIDLERRPALRLANLVAQKRARFLRTQTSALFRRLPAP